MTARTGTTPIGPAPGGSPDYDYGFFRRTSADDSNGVSNAINATLGGTATSVRWIWVEIKPAAASSTNAPAESTSATGTSNAPTVDVAPNAASTSATGTAS